MYMYMPKTVVIIAVNADVINKCSANDSVKVALFTANTTPSSPRPSMYVFHTSHIALAHVGDTNTPCTATNILDGTD